MSKFCLKLFRYPNLFPFIRSNSHLSPFYRNITGYDPSIAFRSFHTNSTENKDHESSSKKDSLIDLLIELNYSGKKKIPVGSKLRLLYNILNNDENNEVSCSSHVVSLILSIWNSRGICENLNFALESLSNSELSLYDKICHEHSRKIWALDPNRKNTLTDNMYYRQLKYELKVLDDEVLSPTVEQFEKKMNLMDYLKPLIESIINGTLHTFGSCENGLWTRGSDIDLCLVVPNCDSKRYMLSKLNLIKSCLTNSDIISKISIISARVPIVKLYDMDDNNICDISINNTIALLNTEYVKTMSRLDERVVTMGRFIKYWATCRKINNRAEGTMSSYTLILQLFYYLQNRDPPIIPTLKEIEIEPLPESESEHNEYNYLTDPNEIKEKCDYLNKNKENVIELLFGFFDFYSQERFNGGITSSTIDMYNNEITENKNGSLIVKCPISKKNVNPFTIRMWQSIFPEFKRANELIKLKQPFQTICQEVSISPLDFQIQQHLLNQQKLLNIFT